MPTRMSNSQIDETLVRVESNLEEYPLFAVKTRNRKENQLVFERRRQGEGGTELVQRWEVEPPAKLGMPGPFDQDVYLAVLQLLEMQDCQVDVLVKRSWHSELCWWFNLPPLDKLRSPFSLTPALEDELVFFAIPGLHGKEWVF